MRHVAYVRTHSKNNTYTHFFKLKNNSVKTRLRAILQRTGKTTTSHAQDLENHSGPKSEYNVALHSFPKRGLGVILNYFFDCTVYVDRSINSYTSHDCATYSLDKPGYF